MSSKSLNRLRAPINLIKGGVKRSHLAHRIPNTSNYLLIASVIVMNIRDQDPEIYDMLCSDDETRPIFDPEMVQALYNHPLIKAQGVSLVPIVRKDYKLAGPEKAILDYADMVLNVFVLLQAYEITFDEYHNIVSVTKSSSEERRSKLTAATTTTTAVNDNNNKNNNNNHNDLTNELTDGLASLLVLSNRSTKK